MSNVKLELFFIQLEYREISDFKPIFKPENKNPLK